MGVLGGGSLGWFVSWLCGMQGDGGELQRSLGLWYLCPHLPQPSQFNILELVPHSLATLLSFFAPA